jgi:hypothetical protein
MKNSNDTIGNRTRYLPTCSAVRQPTALRRAPPHTFLRTLLFLFIDSKQKNRRFWIELEQPFTKFTLLLSFIEQIKFVKAFPSFKVLPQFGR